MHCKDCHQDYEKYFQHQKECPGKVRIDCDVCGTIEQQDLVKKIHEEYDKKGSLKGDDGVFGEYLNRGFVERTEDGWTKYYGCKYWNPIQVDNEVIDRLAIVKRALLRMVKLFPFCVLFPRRMIKWLSSVYDADLKKHEPQWSGFAKALIKAAEKFLIPKDHNENIKSLKAKGDNVVINNEELVIKQTGAKKLTRKVFKVIRRMKAFKLLVMIPQHDSGYYWRLLDFVINVKIKGVWQAFNLGIERETGKDGGISWKYRLFKYLTIPFYPLIKRFCSNVDIDLTEDEIYFGFRRKGYDFLGIPFKKRAAWAEEKDKKLGNVILGNNINV